MKNKPVFCLVLVLFSGCARRDPLGSRAAVFGEDISGSVRVKVMSGTNMLASPAKDVFLKDPSGGKLVRTTGNNGEPGIAQFPATRVGTYTCGLDGQPSTSPILRTVNLTRDHTFEEVVLHADGAYLSITAAPNQDSTYQFSARAMNFNITLVNGSDWNLDIPLAADPSTLPQGWTCQFSPPALTKNGASVMTINLGEATLTPTAKVYVAGLVNGQSLLTQNLPVLRRNWDIALNVWYSSYDWGGATATTGWPVNNDGGIGHIYSLGQAPPNTGWWSDASDYDNWPFAQPSVYTSLSITAYGLPAAAQATISTVCGGGRLIRPTSGNNTGGWLDDARQITAGSTFCTINSAPVGFTEKTDWYCTGWDLYRLYNSNCGHWALRMYYTLSLNSYSTTVYSDCWFPGW